MEVEAMAAATERMDVDTAALPEVTIEPDESEPAVEQKRVVQMRGFRYPVGHFASSLSVPMFGAVQFDRYQVLEKVGEGTFGEVYKARNKENGQIVALKKINMNNPDDGFHITFMREIKSLRQFDHPNVICLEDIVIEKKRAYHRQTERFVYMAFPFMEHDLVGLLDLPGLVFLPGQIKLYMQQLFLGLQYLHQKMYIHRDIKTANLLINQQGDLRIGDMGLARLKDPYRTHYTPGLVTLWYRAPELLLGSATYGRGVDIWGAGCVLAELFLRRPLFPAETELNQLERISRLCGTPSPATMRHFHAAQYPMIPTLQLAKMERRLKEDLREACPALREDEGALDLIDLCLTLDPVSRIDATAALAHPWFRTEPLPLPKADHPTYPSSHEFAKRKRDEERRKMRKYQSMPYAAGPLPTSHPYVHPMQAAMQHVAQQQQQRDAGPGPWTIEREREGVRKMTLMHVGHERGKTGLGSIPASSTGADTFGAPPTSSTFGAPTASSSSSSNPMAPSASAQSASKWESSASAKWTEKKESVTELSTDRSTNGLLTDQAAPQSLSQTNAPSLPRNDPVAPSALEEGEELEDGEDR